MVTIMLILLALVFVVPVAVLLLFQYQDHARQRDYVERKEARDRLNRITVDRWP